MASLSCYWLNFTHLQEAKHVLGVKGFLLPAENYDLSLDLNWLETRTGKRINNVIWLEGILIIFHSGRVHVSTWMGQQVIKITERFLFVCFACSPGQQRAGKKTKNTKSFREISEQQSFLSPRLLVHVLRIFRRSGNSMKLSGGSKRITSSTKSLLPKVWVIKYREEEEKLNSKLSDRKT